MGCSPVWSMSGRSMTAHVTPRVDATGRCFDAVVADDRGQVQVELHGYRTTPFAHPFDQAAAQRIQEALGG
jgi:hypothetical protein